MFKKSFKMNINFFWQKHNAENAIFFLLFSCFCQKKIFFCQKTYIPLKMTSLEIESKNAMDTFFNTKYALPLSAHHAAHALQELRLIHKRQLLGAGCHTPIAQRNVLICVFVQNGTGSVECRSMRCQLCCAKLKKVIKTTGLISLSAVPKA
jgi:hypothetical protein